MALLAPVSGDLAIREAWSPRQDPTPEMPVIGEVLSNGAVRLAADVSSPAAGKVFALKSANGYEIFQPVALSKLLPGEHCLIHLNDRTPPVLGRLLSNESGIVGIEPMGQSWLLEFAAAQVESAARRIG